jgi:hypothetical protein
VVLLSAKIIPNLTSKPLKPHPDPPPDKKQQKTFVSKLHVNKELRKTFKKGIDKALKSEKKCYFCTRIREQVLIQTENVNKALTDSNKG